jgi:hypothetical protein
MRLGKDKQGVLIWIFLQLSISAFSQGELNHSYRFGDNDGDNEVFNENNSAIINYSVPELDIANITNDNGTFFRVSIPGHVSSTVPGKPELPVFCRLITVPDGSGCTVRISDVKSSRIKPSQKKIHGILYPAQEGQTKAAGQTRPRFLLDKEIYHSESIIASDTVKIEYIGTMGNRRISNLLISPVRYNPRKNTLEVITAMRIEISFSSPAAPITKSLMVASETAAMPLEKTLINYNPGEVIPGYSTHPVKMVIITDTAFKKQLQPLFRWKIQKGFNLKVLYRGAGLAGSTYAQLKDTLTRIYHSATTDDPAPEYLLLIGDINRIPKADETTYLSDMYYGEFTGGGDYIPEMYVGRLPVSDTNDVKSVVSKILQYEKFQFADTNKFYSRALITAGNDAAYALNMNGQVNYVRSNYLRSSNNINEYHFYYPQSTYPTVEDSIKKIFRKGISFMNFTGHGDATSWLDPNIKSKDVDSLRNKNMYPFIISNACRTSQYNLANSLGNRMVIVKEKGAIGFIGCSNDSYWDEDYFWSIGAGTVSLEPTYQGTGLGVYDRLFHINGESPSDWYFTLGQINYAGNMAVSESTSSRKKYYWETYNLVGDPSLMPIIGKPGTFGFSIPDTIPNGIQSLTLNADPFSYLAVSHADTLWDASNVSASGSVELTMPGISNDSCLVVVTGQNKIPIIKTVRISNIKGEYISLSSNSINDSQGNNNKMADYGETFFLNLTISNLGLTDASDLYAKISTNSGILTINNDSVYIGTLKARAGIILPEELEMTVDEDISDLETATIELMLKDSKTEKHYKIDICVHAPNLTITSCMINDNLSGNDNGIADPGETFYLVFKVTNQGSSSISGQFIATSNSQDLTILDPSIKSGELKLGETTDIPVKVKLSESCSSGSYLSVSSLLDCTPYILSKDFSFRAGRVRENFESSTFSVFPWINNSIMPWIISGINPYEGIVSARSGQISHDQSSSLIIRARYEKDDSIRFYYRVSSEPNYDNLVFLLNDEVVFTHSGEIPWTKASVQVPAGVNKMEWKYIKDQSVSAGADAAWIDLIDFAESSPVSYIENDIQVARIVSPVQKSKLGREAVILKVLNLGTKQLNSFSLAYYVNDPGSLVKQTFENVLVPFGDSLSVTFTSRADLSRYGTYDIVAFACDNKDDYLANDTLRIHIENDQLNDSVTIYPNPYTEYFTLLIQASGDDRLDISIVNNSGATVFDSYKYVTTGMNTILFPDLRLSPGIYYIKIKGLKINKTMTIVNLRK